MSLYVVVAMCIQMAGEAKSTCSPYATDGKVYQSKALCEVMAEHRYQEGMKALEARALKRGQEPKRKAVYSKCLSADDTIKLLENPDSNGLNL